MSEEYKVKVFVAYKPLSIRGKEINYVGLFEINRELNPGIENFVKGLKLAVNAVVNIPCVSAYCNNSDGTEWVESSEYPSLYPETNRDCVIFLTSMNLDVKGAPFDKLLKFDVNPSTLGDYFFSYNMSAKPSRKYEYAGKLTVDIDIPGVKERK